VVINVEGSKGGREERIRFNRKEVEVEVGGRGGGDKGV